MNNMRGYVNEFRGVYFVLDKDCCSILQPHRTIPTWCLNYVYEITLGNCIIYNFSKFPTLENDLSSKVIIHLPILLSKKFVLYISSCLNENYLNISFSLVFHYKTTKEEERNNYIEIIQKQINDNYENIRQRYFPAIQNYYNNFKYTVKSMEINRKVKVMICSET